MTGAILLIIGLATWVVGFILCTLAAILEKIAEEIDWRD